MQERKANGLHIEMIMSLLQRREPHDGVCLMRTYTWLCGIVMTNEMHDCMMGIIALCVKHNLHMAMLNCNDL